MRYLFLAYLIINPLFYLFDIELRQAQEMCFQISSILLISAGMFFFNKEIKKDKLNIVLGVLFCWFVLIYCKYNTGWSILLNLFLGLGVYFTAIRTLKKEDFGLLVKGLAGVFILSAITQAAQRLGFDIRGQVVTNGKGWILKGAISDASFFGLKASVGVYNAIVMTLILPFTYVICQEFKPKKWLFNAWSCLLVLIYLGLFFITLAISYCTGAFLSGIVAVFLILWFRKRLLFWLSLIPLILGMLFFVVKMDMPLGMMTSRFPMWGMVVQDIHKSPIFGYGLDSFRQPEAKMQTYKQIIRYYKNAFNDRTYRVVKDIRVKDYEIIDWQRVGEIPVEDKAGFEAQIKANANPMDFWDHPHNEFLWLAYETGFTGLAILCGILYLIWKRFKRSKRGIMETATFAALVSVSISSLTQFPLHLARNAHLIPIILALFYLATEETVEDKPNIRLE